MTISPLYPIFYTKVHSQRTVYDLLVNTSMQYVKYGNAGIMVSKFCWGAMNFYERDGEAGGIRMVHEALEAGINFFDTADAYGRGESEVVLGKALKHKRD